MSKIRDMAGVREYAEEYTVELWSDDDNGRLVVRAQNQGGHDCTHVDLVDLIKWVSENMPELMTR